MRRSPLSGRTLGGRKRYDNEMRRLALIVGLPVLTASCVGWFMAKDSFFGVTGQVLQAAGAANTVAVDSETGCGRGGETPVPRCTVTVVAHEPGATPDRPIQTSTISDGRSVTRRR
jgi:hypothetical protein